MRDRSECRGLSIIAEDGWNDDVNAVTGLQPIT